MIALCYMRKGYFLGDRGLKKTPYPPFFENIHIKLIKTTKENVFSR